MIAAGAEQRPAAPAAAGDGDRGPVPGEDHHRAARGLGGREEGDGEGMAGGDGQLRPPAAAGHGSRLDPLRRGQLEEVAQLVGGAVEAGRPGALVGGESEEHRDQQRRERRRRARVGGLEEHPRARRRCQRAQPPVVPHALRRSRPEAGPPAARCRAGAHIPR